jgi:hypothetical protein
MIVVDNEFEIGQIVYLKTDPEQLERIVFGILVFGKSEVIYKLTAGTLNSEHYGFEISTDKDVLKKATA